MTSSSAAPAIRHQASPMPPRNLARVALSQPSGILLRTREVVEGLPPRNPCPFAMTVHDTVTGRASGPRTSWQIRSTADAIWGSSSPGKQPSCTKISKLTTRIALRHSGPRRIAFRGTAPPAEHCSEKHGTSQRERGTRWACRTPIPLSSAGRGSDCRR